MRSVRLAAEGWRDVTWFDEILVRVASGGPGELWFVVGNRRGVLHQVRNRARYAPGCVVAGPAVEHTGLVDLAGVALGVLNPLAELALAVGDAALKGLGQQAVTDGSLDPFGFFDDLVRAAMGHGDTVVFIVDADDRDQDLWNRRFAQYTARAGRLRHQRLVMVVGIADAPLLNPADVDDCYPALVRDAAALATDEKAGWHSVPPLTQDLVSAMLPVSSEASRLLVTVTAADDHLAAERWNVWVRDGTVRPDREGVWSLTGDPADQVLVGIERVFASLVFAGDRASSDRAHLILMCAAMVGDVFCAESVLGNRRTG